MQSMPNYQASLFECSMCRKTYSSISTLNRHKKNNCKNNIEDVSELKAEIKDLKNKLEKEKDDKIKMLENQVKDLKDLIQSGKVASTTYNISVEKYVQQNYPDAPHLMKLDDYSIIEDDEEQLINSLLDQHQKKQLDKYFGDFIISNYKKNDPTNQSIWNSDTVRLTYIIKELLANNNSAWNKDAKGTKTKNYIIKPLLNYVLELVNKYIDIYADYITDNIRHMTKHEACEYSEKGNILTNIKSYVINGLLANDILKYLAPHFHVNKKNDNIILKK